MDSAITKYLMGFFGGGGLVALIFFLFFNQERIELWRSYIFGFITRFAKFADKKYAATDIQGRVNLFMKDTQNKFPKLSAVGIKIEWIEANQDDSPIREENRLIIRMRRSEDQDKNFVQASMAFISFEFLRKAKRYISEGQSESLDVFFAHKLFEKQKPHVAEKFIDEYLAPASRKANVADLLFRFDLVEKVGLFFPVLVQELEHLGKKVVLIPDRDAIVEDVNRFITFLEDYSQRNMGDKTIRMDFKGTYLRCAIVLIAEKAKREQGDSSMFVHHISTLRSDKIETIYLVGLAIESNIEFMNSISDEVCTTLQLEEMCDPIQVVAQVKDSHGTRIPLESYVISLRSGEIERLVSEVH